MAYFPSTLEYDVIPNTIKAICFRIQKILQVTVGWRGLRKKIKHTPVYDAMSLKALNMGTRIRLSVMSSVIKGKKKTIVINLIIYNL